MGYGYDGYDDEDDEQDEHSGDGQGPAGLRAANKRMAKELKQLQKQLEESQKTITELNTQTRSSTLADILRSKGVNPKVSGLIPASVEATKEAVTTWLDEYKDILPVDTKTTADPAAQSTQAADDNQLLPDSHRFDEGEDEDADELNAMREVFEQTQRAVAGATPGGKPQDVSSKLDEIGATTESFDAAIAALGQVPGFKVGGYQS